MFKTILVPTDGSPLSYKAVASALEFATHTGAKIIGIAVAEPYPFPPISESAFTGGSAAYEAHSHQIAHSHAQQIADAAAAARVPCEIVVSHSFSPYEEIIKAAQKYQCDAIFMASHGRKGLSKLFLGSETQKVLAHTTLPVLVVR